MHSTIGAIALNVNRRGRKAKTPEKRFAAVVADAEADARTRARSSIKGEITDVGTGQTIIKMKQAPIAYLIDKRKIGAEERQAADEIALAFQTLSSRLMVRGISYERVDCGRVNDLPWPARVADAVRRYQDWARTWTDRSAQYFDPTLEIVIAAVIDERHIRGIAQDLGFRPAKIERAIICGLRDYAARAKIAHGKQAEQWKLEAAREFAITPDARLYTAYARARLER